jgi:hypothetical protein
MKTKKYYIEVSGYKYEVRRRGKSRQVLLGGDWLDSGDFVNKLAELKASQQIDQLAILGYSVLKKELDL